MGLDGDEEELVAGSRVGDLGVESQGLVGREEGLGVVFVHDLHQGQVQVEAQDVRVAAREGLLEADGHLLQLDGFRYAPPAGLVHTVELGQQLQDVDLVLDGGRVLLSPVDHPEGMLQHLYGFTIVVPAGLHVLAVGVDGGRLDELFHPLLVQHVAVLLATIDVAQLFGESGQNELFFPPTGQSMVGKVVQHQIALLSHDVLHDAGGLHVVEQ